MIKKIQKLFKYQGIRFLFVGGLNTIVGYSAYALLIYIGVYYLIANTISTIVGVIHSYIWNRYFTFKSKQKALKEIIKFSSVYIVSYLIGMFTLYMFKDLLNINTYLAGLVNLFITTLISYFGHKYFSFSTKKGDIKVKKEKSNKEKLNTYLKLAKKRTLKIISDKKFIFLIAFIFALISMWKVNITFGSGDAQETMKVIKGFFYKKPYGSYVMYKGLYAFIPGLISYRFSLLANVHELLLLKVFKALVFAYITTIGLPFIAEKVFKKKPKYWQIYLFTICYWLLERATICLVSVDLATFFIFLLSLVQTIKLFDNFTYKRLLFTGMLLGIGMCFSGQYSFATYIIIIFLIYNIIKNYRKEIKKLLLISLVLLCGITITKSTDIIYNKTVVEQAKRNGYWILDKSDWFEIGLSGHLTYISYPRYLDDQLGLAMLRHDNISNYERIVNGERNIFNTKSYTQFILKYPVPFIVRWTERLFLGLVNDPISYFGFAPGPRYLVISFMATCMFVLWKYIRENLKKFKNLLSIQSMIFFSTLFSILVPSFGHVENRYYIAGRTMLIAVFFMSPLLSKFTNNLKKKRLKISNINTDLISCFIFVIICLVVYFAIYQNLSNYLL